MPLTLDGRFFAVNGHRTFLRAVTYGPFPPDQTPNPKTELPRIKNAGFNAIRTYTLPSPEFLDQLAEHDLLLLTSPTWGSDTLFTEEPHTLTSLHSTLRDFLSNHASHPALGALLIANEIRPDLVRFLGPLQVRKTLEDLLSFTRQLAPDLPLGYANFPTTEYLELRNADFTAFNVFLEDPTQLKNYLQRLHNIAGDRPILISEFGLNTFDRQNNCPSPVLEKQQSELLPAALETAHHLGCAGLTVYSWSDLWFNNHRSIDDWAFGLTRADGSSKPALAPLSQIPTPLAAEEEQPEKISIAICTRNGGERLRNNLPFFEQIEDPNFEILIIDDGSTDNTKDIVANVISHSNTTLRYQKQDPSGLSAARNHAARVASGSILAYIDDDARPHPLWLKYLRQAYRDNPNAAAAGGPNLPPQPATRQNAVVTACPGNASHILLTDTTAEHIPGCNFSIKRQTLLNLGGFDTQFFAAGDDVDLCWRLLEAGHQIAFHPCAVVSHDRRPTIRKFLKQQSGYGHAEALLYHKHPEHFGNDGIAWDGFIYTGGPLSPHHPFQIDHGPLGENPFQMLYLQTLPQRPLPAEYNNPFNRWLVKLTTKLANYCRRSSRRSYGGPTAKPAKSPPENIYTFKSCQKSFPTQHSNPRQLVLTTLQSHGWNIAPNPAEADLINPPLSLILAESTGKDGSLLHVRVDHSTRDDPEVFRQIKSILNSPT
ncbi:MAG: glycosyltransferase [Verrucomicrobiota bacterium]